MGEERDIDGRKREDEEEMNRGREIKTERENQKCEIEREGRRDTEVEKLAKKSKVEKKARTQGEN